jgi:microcystin-dependent protein
VNDSDVAEFDVEFIAGGEGERSFGHKSAAGNVPDTKDAGTLALGGSHGGVEEHTVPYLTVAVCVLFAFGHQRFASSPDAACKATRPVPAEKARNALKLL